LTSARRGGIALRIAAAIFGVAGLTLAILAAGVLGLGYLAFARLMIEHGESADSARQMFAATVTPVFVVAAAAAVLVGLALSFYLAARITSPIEVVGAAARRVAEGDLRTRVPRAGPPEVAQLADSFNQMADSLEEQERMRAELIANFAHELRTPLTNLRGYLEAMRDLVMEPSPEVFDSLREEVERLDRLSRSLDALAEGERIGQPEPVDVDLEGAIRTAAELARPALERSGIGLRLEVPSGLRARASADHLAQVLGNLLQNAGRYTRDGGTVTISARAEADTVLVSVTNTGEGIPSEDLPHIFERFYRVDKSRDRASGGAGIGLAIVKQLVEAAGGRVGVETGDGSTRFWFSLPA
jgi:signal transduction histidine kinase